MKTRRTRILVTTRALRWCALSLAGLGLVAAAPLRAQPLPVAAARALDAEQWDVAVAELTKALQREPRAVVLLQQRGRAYRESGRFAQALADYDAAIAIDSTIGGVYVGRAASRIR